MSDKTITQPKLLDKVRNEMRAGRYSVIHKFKGVKSPLDSIL